MDVISTVSAMMKARDGAERPLGLVPTMGYLHQGHMTLVERARNDNKSVVVSIFVNPTQFGSREDLDGYPRDFERDVAMLAGQGVDIVFATDSGQMYPPGYSTYIDVGEIGERLEGKHRPGHFRGVVTVVTKLLTIVRPDRAYFGQKDGQQSLVIERLNRDLNLGAEIVVMPTVREPDGLAMSSRNVYLTPRQRGNAVVLYKALSRASEMWRKGETDAGVLRGEMERVINEGSPAKLDYVSIAALDTLEEMGRVAAPAMASVAAWFGKARLIDNVILKDEGTQ